MWPRPKRADEYLLFHSKADEYCARDKIETCRDFRQYRKEEWQSFRDRAYEQLIYRLAQQSKRSPIPATTNPEAQRVKPRPTPRLLPQRVGKHPFATQLPAARRTLTDVARRAMTNAEDYSDDDSYSTDDYPVSDNNMPTLNRRDDSSSNDDRQ